MKGKIAEGRRGVNAFSSLYHPCHSTIEIGKGKKIASTLLENWLLATDLETEIFRLL
jgi:hypothetical protein